MAGEALQALVEQLHARPIGMEEMSIEQIRANVEALAAPAPEDVTCEAVTANGVPAEWIAAPNAATDRVILFCCLTATC